MWLGLSSLLAIRVTSWLPMNVSGMKDSTKSLWRRSAQSSSWKLASLRLLQMAFHSSYWVTESKVASSTMAE
jgi:hypothetical protein